MISRQPWLSVLIPVFNGEAYFSQALQSIADQGDAGIECLIVDGGSQDRTVEIARQFQCKLNLRILERPDSPNWVWSTNHALHLASAPYSTILHQDDYWLSGRTSRIRQMADSAPEVAVFVHDVLFVNVAGRRIGRWTNPWPHAPQRIETMKALEHLLVQCFIACPAPVFCTQTARNVGGMDESLRQAADWDFWLKLVRQAPVMYLNEPLAAYRLHPLSQTVEISRDVDNYRGQLDLVVERHAAMLTPPELRGAVVHAARFSNLLNATLAARFHGNEVGWTPVLREALALGVSGLTRYVRNSRILSRVLSRLRAGMRPAQAFRKS